CVRADYGNSLDYW
nr:immunoglobulin heavy chain junction region [Macaca mulatta]MOW75607.1 immunoglobulin heavy chain junction region [Macaca mulatta]MOW75845.1 immunoglobulin heavy chain junction region [Macaca mulatta]MOW76172.1 immunoglobulin heavy chain junction region [Macaca mulatta]MOW76241.1 immunoglobulin heavy chain junction region [Macaca mulatta]